MERVTEILPAGQWPASGERDRITLTYQDRHRRRVALTGEGGTTFLLDLPQAVLLREGDGARLSGGGFVRVQAETEALLEVTAGSAEELARLAWHLGNRHLPAEIGRDRILIQRDHVIANMLTGLGAQVREVAAPFNPVTGAYSSREHHHGHAHDREHDHQHDHEHGHDEGRGE
jgi:urease accessory protein